MSDHCTACTSLDSTTWRPITEPLEKHEFSIDFFHKMHLHETRVTGSHYRENACLMDSGEFARCTTQFFMYSVEGAQPPIELAGDGFLGLGLADGGHADENWENYSTLHQLREHGLIDELKFSIYSASRSGSAPYES